MGDIDGRSKRVIAEAELEFSATAPSPDGRWVAFCAEEHAPLSGSWVGLGAL